MIYIFIYLFIYVHIQCIHIHWIHGRSTQKGATLQVQTTPPKPSAWEGDSCMTNGITYLLHCSRYLRTMILNLLRLINDHACGGGKTKRGGFRNGCKQVTSSQFDIDIIYQTWWFGKCTSFQTWGAFCISMLNFGGVKHEMQYFCGMMRFLEAKSYLAIFLLEYQPTQTTILHKTKNSSPPKR